MTINTLIKPSVKACTQISHNVKTMCLFSGLGDLHPNRKKKLLSEDPPSQSNSNPYGHGGWRLDATLFSGAFCGGLIHWKRDLTPWLGLNQV